MLVFVLAAIATATLFYHYCVGPMYYWKNRNVKQGKPVWFFGDSWGPVTKRQSWAEMVQSAYNRFAGTRYCGMYQFVVPTLLLRDPELIKQVTVQNFDHFVDHRTFVPEDADPLWGKNLFALKGKKWRDMRLIMSPAFTSRKLRTMFVLMSECAENFLKYFLKNDEDIIEIEANDIFTRYTSDVIATTVFGLEVDSLSDKMNEFYMVGRKATTFKTFWESLGFFVYLFVPKFLIKFFKISIISKKHRNFYYRTVNKTIKFREEKGIIRPDIINLLTEARREAQKLEECNDAVVGHATMKEWYVGKCKLSYKDITNEDIAAQAFIFFVGGFDTTAALMSFLSYELAINQDVQTKLREEIRQTNEECDGKLTYEALMGMKYMDMVVCETLRKWPGAVFLDRICTKPFTVEPVSPGEQHLHLEEGTVIMIPVFGIHYDPQYYPDPERFDPERFSETNRVKINPYTYLPFGIGPRNCIGSRFALLEAKMLFFHILAKFEIVPVEKTQIPLKLSKSDFNVTTDDGFWCGLKAIKQLNK